MVQRKPDEETLNAINKVSNYIDKVIEYEGKSLTFSLLDYYSLTNISFDRLYYYVRFNPSIENKFLYEHLNKKSKLNNYIVLDSKVIERKHLSVNNKEITLKEIEEIFYILTSNGIPLLMNVVEIAIMRYFRNQPILPFKDLDNLNKEDFVDSEEFSNKNIDLGESYNN